CLGQHTLWPREAPAVEEAPRALLTLPRAILHEDAPAREDDRWHAGDLHTLIEIVVGALMLARRADRVRRLGIPDHDVGVAAGGNDALLWVDAEELGGIGAAELHPAIE